MPSEEEKVFCLETCGKPVTLEDEDEVDVRDGANIVSAIVCGRVKWFLFSIYSGRNLEL